MGTMSPPIHLTTAIPTRYVRNPPGGTLHPEVHPYWPHGSETSLVSAIGVRRSHRQVRHPYDTLRHVRSAPRFHGLGGPVGLADIQGRTFVDESSATCSSCQAAELLISALASVLLRAARVCAPVIPNTSMDHIGKGVVMAGAFAVGLETSAMVAMRGGIPADHRIFQSDRRTGGKAHAVPVEAQDNGPSGLRNPSPGWRLAASVGGRARQHEGASSGDRASDRAPGLLRRLWADMLMNPWLAGGFRLGKGEVWTGLHHACEHPFLATGQEAWCLP